MINAFSNFRILGEIFHSTGRAIGGDWAVNFAVKSALVGSTLPWFNEAQQI
tara:strand:- start:2616 stop:2768 length:153 start_codon:yes stop_codon:yes gene_type:complete